jgi:alcohol dehydrogenase class IV
VLLPWVIEYNVPSAEDRFETLARLMAARDSAPAGADHAVASDAVDLMTAWLTGLDAPRRLPWDDWRGEDLDLAVEDVAGRQMALDNPRESTAADLRGILERCIAGW